MKKFKISVPNVSFGNKEFNGNNSAVWLHFPGLSWTEGNSN